MIGALVLSVSMIGTPIPQAAFTARVFLPGNAKSSHDLYLWRGPELGAERLYRSGRECYGVRWIDRNTLQWIEFEGYWSGSRTMYTMQLDLRTFKVAELQKEMMEPSHYLSETRTDHIVSAPSGFDPLKIAYVSEDVGSKLKWVGTPSDDYPSRFTELEYKGIRLEIGKSFQEDARFVIGRSGSEFFLHDVSFNEPSSSRAGVWRLDFDAMEVEQIIESSAMIEFHPSTPFWCRSTNSMQLVELDGVPYWKEKGYVGNWQTGEVWNVMEKPSLVGAVSLRPERGG
ncbi:MAG: hypothetical protein IH944_07895 [Armatimonadetes bacterium]|nr:hypothetical protein [Armatimonadota bacterium]